MAIWYDTLSLPLANISARGGNDGDLGAAGTLYLEDRAVGRGVLRIDNASISSSQITPLRTSLSALEDIVLANRGRLLANSTYSPALTIASTVTVPTNSDLYLGSGLSVGVPAGPSPGLEVVGGKLITAAAIDGYVSNSGWVLPGGSVVFPGTSPGKTDITGTFEQLSAGQLGIELAGTAPGSGYDQVAVSDTVKLGGTLTVALISGFVPSLGDSFALVTYGAREGRFAVVSVPALSGGLYLRPSYRPDGFVLEAKAPDPLPLVDSFEAEEETYAWWTWTAATGGSSATQTGGGFEVTQSADCQAVGTYGLEALKSDTQTAYLERSFVSETGLVVAAFWVRPGPATGSDAVTLGYKSARLSNTESRNLGVAFTAAGNVVARSPGLPVVGSYTPGAWCQVVIAASAAAQRFEVYVWDASGNLLADGRDLAWERAGYASLGYVTAWSDDSAPPHAICLDEVHIHRDPWVAVTPPALADSSASAGVAWGDYDADGYADLYLSQAGANVLTRSVGDGTFTDVTAAPLDDAGAGQGVAWCDFDRDGDLDLALANLGGPDRVFRNEGGSFVTVSLPPGSASDSSTSVSWADFDRDEDLDLYLGRCDGPNLLLRNVGYGFVEAVGVLADAGSTYGVAWGDCDNDGDQDLYVANHGPNRLYRNEGNGTFTDITAPPLDDGGEGYGVAWGDVDNDGDLDLYVGNGEAGTNRLLRNDGGSFTDVTAGPLSGLGSTRSVSWADVDLDGDLDLLLVSADSTNELLRNDLGGVFTDVTPPALAVGGAAGQGAAWGDYDGDGDLDLYLANASGANVLGTSLSSLSTAHWLGVDLVGVVSGLGGLGSRVRAVAGGSAQVREVDGGSGYLSQGSATVVIGLGTSATVDTLQVRWPTGFTQVVTGIAADQVVAVTEDGHPRVSYLSPNAAPNDGGALTVQVVGYFLNRAQFTSGVPDLTLRGPLVIGASSGSLVDPAHITATFDLTGAPVGLYALEWISTHDAGTRQLLGALFVHDSELELARSTTSGAEDRMPDLSADGHLAFISDRTGAPSLMVKAKDAPDASVLAPLSQAERQGAAASPSWSPDAARIAYADSLHGIVTVAVDDTTDVVVVGAPGDQEPSWSPAGEPRIAFSRDLSGTGTEHRIFTVDPEGMNATALTTAPVGTAPYQDDRGATWSPDGMRLTLARDSYDAGHTLTGSALYTLSGAQGEAAGLRPLTSTVGSANAHPAWSPDGRWIAFSSTRGGRGEEVYVIDSRGERYGLIQVSPASFAGVEGEPAWSADGTELYVRSDAAGSADIWASTALPIHTDSDGDLVADVFDQCPTTGLALGQIDRNFDGCPDTTSSLRTVRYWGADQFPLRYALEPEGDPRIGDGSDLEALRAGFEVWAAVPGVEIEVEEDTLSAVPEEAVAGDGLNMVTFKDPQAAIPGFLAMAVVTSAERDTVVNGRWHAPGEIIDADIVFNAAWFSFSTPTHPGTVDAWDLRSVATHEVGHVLGLAHSSVPSATMFYVVPPDTSAASLAADDLALIRRLYGTSAPALSAQGQVRRFFGSGVPGAVVLAIGAATGDTLQMTITDPDGLYRFFDVPAAFKVYVTPLDGGAGVGGLRPENVNALVELIVETDFAAEYWDGVDEDELDEGLGVVIAPGAPELSADIILNIDGIAPEVLAFTPPAGATDVSAITSLNVWFSEPIALDSLTIHGNLVLRPVGGASVAGVVGLLADDSLLVFTPNEPLAYGTEYIFRAGPLIRDRTGNPMVAADSISFTTMAQPPVAITTASPGEVPVGGLLVIAGTGFDPMPAGNWVLFAGGVGAQPTAATLERLWVTVPAGSQSGLLRVEVGASSSNEVPILIAAPKGIPSGNRVAERLLGTAPRKLALDAGGELLFVATASGVTVLEADPEGLTVVGTVPVAGGCADVVALPDGMRALALGASPPALHVLSATVGGGVQTTDVVALMDEPLGLAVVPGGGEVLIAFADHVGMYDVRPGATLGVELRNWGAGGRTFRGDLAISPVGQEAYGTTGGGTIAVLGLLAGEGTVTHLTGGTEPRELATTPDGSRLLAVDGHGRVRLFAPRGPLLQSLSLGGGFMGLTVSPEGNFAYACDHLRNTIRLLDLRGTVLLDVGAFPTGIDPVDIVTGSDGRYLYVITGGSDQVEVYDTQQGPRLSALSPASGAAGTLVTVVGSGFDSEATGNTVYFGTTPQVAEQADPAGRWLVVAQPAGASSGDLQVVTGELSSNGLPYRVVARSDPGRFALGCSFVAGGPSVPAQLAVTHGGQLLLATQDDGSLTVLDGDGSSAAGLHRLRQQLTPAQTQLGAGGELALVSGDGRLYALDHVQGRVVVFQVDAAAAEPVAFSGYVYDAIAGAILEPSAIAAVPDGQRVLVTSAAQGLVYHIATVSDSVTSRITGFTAPSAVRVHPGGARAYVADGASVAVIDIDLASAGFGTQLATIGVPGVTDTLRLSATPDGRRLFAVGRSSGGYDHELHVIDTEDGSPTQHTVVAMVVVGTGGAAAPVLALDHGGQLLYVTDPNTAAQRAYTLASGTPVAIGGAELSAPALAATRAMAVSADDARLYATGPDDSLRVTLLTPATALTFQSGTGQVGVVGQPVPLPFVVRVGGAAAEQVAGTLVTFRVNPGEGDFGYGDQRHYGVANTLGLVGVEHFVLGSVEGTIELMAELDSLTFSTPVLAVADTSLTAPVILAVQPATDFTAGVNTPVAAEFSKRIDPSTVSPASFGLHRQGSADPVAGNFTYSAGGRRVVFTPATPLSYASSYVIEVSTAGILRDFSGHAVTNPGAFSFTTLTPPAAHLQAITPRAATVGAPVVLAGTGFSTTLSENRCWFGSVSAPVIQGDPGALRVVVPTGAVSDSVYVTVRGVPSNAIAFEVLQPPPSTYVAVRSHIAVPSGGQQITIAPSGTEAYMPSRDANVVVPIHIPTQTAGVPIPVGLRPFGVKVSPTADRLYVSNFESHDVSVIDIDSHSPTYQQVIATVPTGRHPTGLAVHPDGRRLYVSNYGDSTLTILDLDPSHGTYGLPVATVNLQAVSTTVAIVPDGSKVIAGTADGFLILHPITGQIQERVTVGSATRALAIVPNGAFVLLLATDGRLHLVDIRPTATGVARASATTGTSPTSLEITPEGGFVFLTHQQGLLDIWRLRVRIGAGAYPDPATEPYALDPVTQVDVGENPQALCFNPSDPQQVLVVNAGTAASVTVAEVEPLYEWTDLTTTLLGSAAHGAGLAWADYDDDGYQDLYVAYQDSTANKLLRNLGDGTFENAAAAPLDDRGPGAGVAWGDFDRDGDPDLYLANCPGTNRLLRNDGAGLFTDVTTGLLAMATDSSQAAGWVDVDRDGDLDLYVTHLSAPNRLLRNDGGVFTAITDSSVTVLLGTARTTGFAWADYDNDDDQDVYLVDLAGTNRLVRNDGPSGFTDVTAPPLHGGLPGHGATWADYDNDGDLDLFVINRSGGNKLYRNDGASGFTDVSGDLFDPASESWDAAWADYDNDGYLDLYVVNRGLNQLFHNDGAGVLREATVEPLHDPVAHGRTLSWADFDNDGDLDLYVASLGANRLFRNNLLNPHHWLTVALIGHQSDRHGIGARLRLVAGGQTQIREIAGHAGYLSQPTRQAHFGLGPAATIEELEVTWPAGTVTRLYDLPADQQLTLDEALSGTTFVRADDDGSGEINISDAIYSLTYQFASGPVPGCLDAADTDDSGEINISDPLYNLAYQFADGPEPPAPFPDCGADPSIDAVRCRDFPPCSPTPPRSRPAAVPTDLAGNSIALQPVPAADPELLEVELVVTTSLPLTACEATLVFDPRQLAYLSLQAPAATDLDFLSATGKLNPGQVRLGAVPDLSLRHPLTPGTHCLGVLQFRRLDPAALSTCWLEIASARFVYADRSELLLEGIAADLVPTEFRFYPCAPNPFRAVTHLRFALPTKTHVTLTIYSPDGRLVRRLIDAPYPPGYHQADWNGRSQTGHRLAAGVYFYDFHAGAQQRQGRMILMW